MDAVKHLAGSIAHNLPMGPGAKLLSDKLLDDDDDDGDDKGAAKPKKLPQFVQGSVTWCFVTTHPDGDIPGLKDTVGQVFRMESQRMTDASIGYHPMTVMTIPDGCFQGLLADSEVEPVYNSELFMGPLSRVVVHYDEHVGVQGIQQFFGGRRASYQGNRGNFTETAFEISYSDPLVTLLVNYDGDPGRSQVNAVRLISASGQDSGWLGKATKNGSTVIVQEFSEPIQVGEGDQYGATSHFHPIYAIDLCRSKPVGELGIVNLLTTRHTFPFDVRLKVISDTTTDPEPQAGPTVEREWMYHNGSPVSQTIELFEEMSNTLSHTVSTTTTDSVSKSLSLSMGLSAMYEGIALSMNRNETHTTTHTITQGDSITCKTRETRVLNFPITVPANTKIKATLFSSKTTRTIEARVHITYKDYETPDVELPVTVSGVDAFRYSVDVTVEG